MYETVDDVLADIDAIPLGDPQWASFNVRYSGPVNANSPSWQQQTYTVHTRDTFAVMEHFLKNQDFAEAWDYAPYEAYSPDNTRTWSNLLSASWAWKQAVGCLSSTVHLSDTSPTE